MDVLVENTQIDNGIPRVQGIPALDTQSAETKVLVADGGTVVIGGIIITQQRTDIPQVPLAGSLPLIGHLFKRTNITISSSGTLVLPDAANHPWLILDVRLTRSARQNRTIRSTRIEETEVSSIFL